MIKIQKYLITNEVSKCYKAALNLKDNFGEDLIFFKCIKSVNDSMDLQNFLNNISELFTAMI